MGCEIEGQVPSPKAGARMRRAESGMGLGAEVLMRMLLGRVEVRVVLSAMGAPESHSTSRTHHEQRGSIHSCSFLVPLGSQ